MLQTPFLTLFVVEPAEEQRMVEVQVCVDEKM